MAYTNETTHYGIPLPLGSDLTTPMDYNESMRDIDTTLFESKTDSASALQKANQLQLDLGATNDEVTAVKGRVTSLEGTTTTQGQAILQNTQDIVDVRADALDMIVAKDEGTAQVATVAVDKGEYFRYNDVLYIATDNIAIGDTIVPNENCKATNVGTELVQINSSLSKIGQYSTGSPNKDGTFDITIAESGIYLISARANASDASHAPEVSVYKNTESYLKQLGLTGGSVELTYVHTLNANDLIQIQMSNIASNALYNSYTVARIG